jgi:hypothetical protein
VLAGPKDAPVYGMFSIDFTKGELACFFSTATIKTSRLTFIVAASVSPCGIVTGLLPQFGT